MAPLYLAAEVAWLGAAKIALGWPLWVASIALMGWLLLAGHTPSSRGGAGRRARRLRNARIPWSAPRSA